MKRLLAYHPNDPAQAIYRILLATVALLLGFGLVVQGPGPAIAGLWRIFVSPAALITDYIQVGGLGGAFLNAGLAMLLAVLLTKASGARFGGLAAAVAYIVAGFALFGKTLPNMLPIILGSWLYARFRKEPFSNHVYTALFATCLGPVVSHAAINAPILNTALRLAVALMLGLIIGFVVPAVAALMATVHKGMLIFNVGLTAGMVSTALVAILKNFGWQFGAVSDSWTTGNDLLLGIALAVLFGLQILTGFVLNGYSFKGLGKLRKHSGQSPSDFTRLEGLPVTLMNMGILGFMMTAYVLAVGGALNGPTIGGILTVCGFGAFCMHYYNVIWPILGIVLLSFVSVWNLNEPGILLAVLFVPCIAPIAGKHGPVWGIVSGMVHVSLVRQTAVNFGWLNLYNNGFAAGLTCIVLLPVINVVIKELQQAKEQKRLANETK
ncbi:MAG: DUF1576 domain-containing protein [Faecalibacterium sp.]|nr:DUF1576 domain-containing protein [Faecalibacterium sp.]